MGCGNIKTADILDVAIVTPANILIQRKNYNTGRVDKAIAIGNSSFIYRDSSYTYIGFGDTPEIYLEYFQGDIFDSYNLPDQSATTSEFLSPLRMSAKGSGSTSGLQRCGRHSLRNTEDFAKNYQIYFYKNHN